MSEILHSIFSCCGLFGSNDDDPERAPLLESDILPEAPPQPAGRTTEQQLAEQNAIRQILNEASERFVNIESPSPFTRPSPYSSRSGSPSSSTSPTRPHPPLSHSQETSHSTWRPTDAPIKVIHLGTNFEPHATGPGRISRGGASRPTSSHSLRTIGKTNGKKMKSPLGNGGENDEEDADGEEDFESKYGTMASYRTAHQGEADDGETTPTNDGSGKKRSIKDMWSETDGEFEDDSEAAKARQEELRVALKELEDSMETFTLKPNGPIVEELTDESESSST